MTSESEAFVWVWLPGQTSPVVAGRLSAQGDQLVYTYGQSYLARPDAISLYEPELPLRPGLIRPLEGLSLPSCLRDASPDAWGRRVLISRLAGVHGRGAAEVELDELTYFLRSGSDRVGALDFQRSPTTYVPRGLQSATLEELLEAASLVDRGLPLTQELDEALLHGTSLGGARPKVHLEAEGRRYIAKFSASRDLYSVVKAEFIAMSLAVRTGLDVAPVKLVQALGKDVLMVERFDRVRSPGGGWLREGMVSALTLLGLDELMARYSSYATLAELIRHRFEDPRRTLRELFGRLVFNILCGNTDDHARNHAAFWDGERLRLTPAYDLCPQSRTGNEASQAMLISEGQRLSRLAVCVDAARNFLLSTDEAVEIVRWQVHIVRSSWSEVCDLAQLSAVDRATLWGRQFLNPYAFEGASPALTDALTA
jgi:serine/threonine-protein kinase HipA